MNDACLALSALSDEVAPEVDAQLDVLDRLGIRAVDLRHVLGRNVLDLADAAATELARRLRARGFRVACLASPIGKATLDEPPKVSLAQCRRALELAAALDAPAIRIFSFYVPPGRHAAVRDDVLARLTEWSRLAAEAGRVLLLENERGLWGDTPERCQALLEGVGSPALRAVFDPGNFVGVGCRPFDEAFTRLAPHIAHVHVKDARRDPETGRTHAVVPGAGDGQIGELLTALQGQGWRGYLAFEPHLAQGGPRGGYSGPELFTAAVDALRFLARSAGVHLHAAPPPGRLVHLDTDGAGCRA